MNEETLGGSRAGGADGVALTPRPVRLLIVGRIHPGAEHALRAAQAHFPHQAAIEAGIDAVEAYLGSGHYAVTLEIDREDVQHVLTRFFDDERVRRFRASLAPFVEGLPGAEAWFGEGDRFHGESGSPTGEKRAGGVATTGDLPFAASMYRWRTGEPPQTGIPPRPRTAT